MALGRTSQSPWRQLARSASALATASGGAVHRAAALGSSRRRRMRLASRASVRARWRIVAGSHGGPAGPTPPSWAASTAPRMPRDTDSGASQTMMACQASSLAHHYGQASTTARHPWACSSSHDSRHGGPQEGGQGCQRARQPVRSSSQPGHHPDRHGRRHRQHGQGSANQHGHHRQARSGAVWRGFLPGTGVGQAAPADVVHGRSGVRWAALKPSWPGPRLVGCASNRPGAIMAVDDLEFREFFASQYARLCWLGLLLTGDRAEAEELAQDALVRTYNRWARVRRPNDPAAYARRVVINRHRSRLRRALLEARYLRRNRASRPIRPTLARRRWSCGPLSPGYRPASGRCWRCATTRT